jgi:hypothetical protein
LFLPEYKTLSPKTGTRVLASAFALMQLKLIMFEQTGDGGPSRSSLLLFFKDI